MRVPIDTIASFEDGQVFKLNEILMRLENAVNTVEFTQAFSADAVCAMTPENMSSNIIELTWAASGDERTVIHTLNRIPAGMLVLKSDRPGAALYAETAWTSTIAYVKANVAATIRFIIF